MRFASGGSDGLVKYWIFNNQAHKFINSILDSRTEWIRDLAFAQANCTVLEGIENSQELLAITSDIEGVKILRKENHNWTQPSMEPSKIIAEKISWGIDTNDLSVLLKDGSSKVYKENKAGVWIEVYESIES